MAQPVLRVVMGR